MGLVEALKRKRKRKPEPEPSIKESPQPFLSLPEAIVANHEPTEPNAHKPPEFPQFTTLPYEIRVQIWTGALEDNIETRPTCSITTPPAPILYRFYLQTPPRYLPSTEIKGEYVPFDSSAKPGGPKLTFIPRHPKNLDLTTRRFREISSVCSEARSHALSLRPNRFPFCVEWPRREREFQKNYAVYSNDEPDDRKEKQDDVKEGAESVEGNQKREPEENKEPKEYFLRYNAYKDVIHLEFAATHQMQEEVLRSVAGIWGPPWSTAGANLPPRPPVGIASSVPFSSSLDKEGKQKRRQIPPFLPIRHLSLSANPLALQAKASVDDPLPLFLSLFPWLSTLYLFSDEKDDATGVVCKCQESLWFKKHEWPLVKAMEGDGFGIEYDWYVAYDDRVEGCLGPLGCVRKARQEVWGGAGREFPYSEGLGHLEIRTLRPYKPPREAAKVKGGDSGAAMEGQSSLARLGVGSQGLNVGGEEEDEDDSNGEDERSRPRLKRKRQFSVKRMSGVFKRLRLSGH
ncbi:hypothetical protein MKZ38_007395 [Zalerion maritima]|uniref:2EXR domain-containing protein n=1 Tax=Zalerion maritima TaxID=339359 RepID=A0AAD5RIH2_9PEZI|nr:hypothetical protein MKZ38_007395 [Zalerion maritima]